jgi:hypothetical protein
MIAMQYSFTLPADPGRQRYAVGHVSQPTPTLE